MEPSYCEDYNFDEPASDAPDVAEAKLTAEIAARLVELSEVASRSRVSRWLDTLQQLRTEYPAAMWLYLAWQSGDTRAIAASFETQGKQHALPRQAVQQTAVRAFEALARVNPGLAKAMRELFEQHSPEARAATKRKQEATEDATRAGED